MLNSALKFGALILILGMIFYGGITIYANFLAQPDTGEPDLPEKEKAGYYVQIKNTGNLLLTNDYEKIGEAVGQRTYILHGYFEQIGQDFKYRDHDIVLAEAVFGEIVVIRRRD